VIFFIKSSSNQDVRDIKVRKAQEIYKEERNKMQRLFLWRNEELKIGKMVLKSSHSQAGAMEWRREFRSKTIGYPGSS
jgi:hypothetical protein